MKASEADLNSSGAQRPSNIHSARKLVRLDADECDQTKLAAKLTRDTFRADTSIRFVEGSNDEFDVVAEYATALAFQREAIQHCQGVRGNRGAEPLDNITVVIVV